MIIYSDEQIAKAILTPEEFSVWSHMHDYVHFSTIIDQNRNQQPRGWIGLDGSYTPKQLQVILKVYEAWRKQ